MAVSATPIANVNEHPSQPANSFLSLLWKLILAIGICFSFAAIFVHAGDLQEIQTLRGDVHEIALHAQENSIFALLALTLAGIGWICSFMVKRSGKAWMVILLSLALSALGIIYISSSFLLPYYDLLYDEDLFRVFTSEATRIPLVSLAILFFLLTLLLTPFVLILDFVGLFLVRRIGYYSENVGSGRHADSSGFPPVPGRRPWPVGARTVFALGAVGLLMLLVWMGKGLISSDRSDPVNQGLVPDGIGSTEVYENPPQALDLETQDLVAQQAEEERLRAEEAARQAAAEEAQRLRAFNEVLLMAQVLGSPYQTAPDVAPAYSLYDIVNRESSRLRNLGSMQCSEIALESFRFEMLTKLTPMMGILNRIEQIQGAMPSNPELFRDTFQALLEARENRLYNEARISEGSDAILGYVNRAQAESNIETLQEQFRDLEWQFRSAFTHQLHVHAITYSGDTNDKAFGISYNPSWNGAFAQDMVTLTNSSGSAISNAVLVVQLKNGTERDDHVHFIASWPPGETRYFHYRYWNDDYLVSQTRDVVNHVVASVYGADSWGRSELVLNQTDLDQIFQRYLKNTNFVGSYLPYSEHWLSGVSHQGIDFRFSGIDRLPITQVEVTFKSGGYEDTVYWEVGESVYRQGEDHAFRSELFDFAPSEWVVKLSFKNTSYVHELNWTR